MKRFCCLLIALWIVNSCEWKADPRFFEVSLHVANHTDTPIDCSFFYDETASSSEIRNYLTIPSSSSSSKYGGAIIFLIKDIAYSFDDVYNMISSRFPNPSIKIYEKDHFGEDDFLLEEIPLMVFKGKQYDEEISGFYLKLSYADFRPSKHPCTAIWYYYEGKN